MPSALVETVLKPEDKRYRFACMGMGCCHMKKCVFIIGIFEILALVSVVVTLFVLYEMTPSELYTMPTNLSKPLESHSNERESNESSSESSEENGHQSEESSEEEQHRRRQKSQLFRNHKYYVRSIVGATASLVVGILVVALMFHGLRSGRANLLLPHLIVQVICGPLEYCNSYSSSVKSFQQLLLAMICHAILWEMCLHPEVVLIEPLQGAPGCWVLAMVALASVLLLHGLSCFTKDKRSVWRRVFYPHAAPVSCWIILTLAALGLILELLFFIVLIRCYRFLKQTPFCASTVAFVEDKSQFAHPVKPTRTPKYTRSLHTSSAINGNVHLRNA